MFQRLAGNDRNAADDGVENYGNCIWALARKFTASPEEEAARGIFANIWRYAERGEENESAEKLVIALIARRRLLTCLR